MCDGIKLTRRQALATLAAFAVAQGWERCAVAETAHRDTREEIERMLRPLFVTDDAEMFRLAVEAYQQCILGKLRPADEPLRNTWLVPGDHYTGQWLWDTTFVTDLLAILPGQDATIRGVYQNYWDFCERWNATRPEYAHGMVANYMAPFRMGEPFPGKQWRTFPAFSQAPLLAWGVERVYRRNHDLTLVHAALPYLEAFHEWYWRERDVTNAHMVGVGSYSGDAQHARFETYDHEVDLDTLRMTQHPTRRGENEGAWYGDILIPANTAYLLLSEQSLTRLATVAGDLQMAARRQARYDAGAQAMRAHMWDEAAGCFLAVRRDSLEKIRNPTVGSFTPLMAGVPSKRQAALMAQALEGPEWATPLPVPTVSRMDKAFQADGFWRGDVWPAPVYQVATGLARYGHHRLAAKIAGASLDNALRVGISEHYDALTGAPLGERGLGMSAVILTMALDGLSPAHRIAVRKGA